MLHMTSQCHTLRQTLRVRDTRLLQAAQDCVLENGIRRTTLSEIARRAGVSRMTLYRRYSDVRSVVIALLNTEFTAILQQARSAAGTGTAREQLVTAAVHAVRLLHSSPLLQRVLRTEAELLLPYLVSRLGSTQRAAEEFVLEYLSAGHADGSIRPAEPAVQARTLLLVLQSFVISQRPAAQGLPTADLLDELRRVLDAALRPEPANSR
ncbi:TetR family transcriptional regulator [Saccharopolyspora rectivirgula]|uniref:TetR family transcriptional regulator n=2 Tax=Saccharopolyspora rectivirgula TaxID=28042 RepID=A0A073BCI7_9PSEU|nr:TetR family transcriptional regulator [Saccharopolyspora rectivirgula]